MLGADFLTPYYDITYSPRADVYKRRRKSDPYEDFKMLSEDTREPIVFFGGRDYLPLFGALTSFVKGSRTVFYNSAVRPAIGGCSLVRFETTTRTNWHYGCANAFLRGEISLQK